MRSPAPDRNGHSLLRGEGDRAKRMHDMFIEWRFSLPADAPAKLVEDIEAYSAFVDFQSKMLGPSSWYQRLS